MVKDQNLSEEQEQILFMLTKEFETPRRIAIRRGTSLRAVYKTIAKLRKKGLLSRGFTRGFTKNGTGQSCEPPKRLKNYTFVSGGTRLHGQEFNIKILFKTGSYDKLRVKKDFISVDDNTIRLYKDSLEVYSNKSFFGDDEHRATAQSFLYWNKFFIRLEALLKVVIVKGVNTCIRQVNAHYSLINNDLAKDYNEKKVKLRVYANEDNRLWFQIDNSLNLNEAETLHPSTAKQDYGGVKDFFNDLRDNNPPNLSDITGFLSKTIRLHYETANGLKSIVDVLKVLMPKPEEKKVQEQEEVFIKPGYVG